MKWRIEISYKNNEHDVVADHMLRAIRDFGVSTIDCLSFTKVFTLTGSLSEADVELIAKELLTDPVTQNYSYGQDNKRFAKFDKDNETKHVIEITYNPGVMDPVEESTLKGISDLGIKNIESVHTSRVFILQGKLTRSQKQGLIEKVFSNKIIEHETNRESELQDAPISSQEKVSKVFELKTVDLLKASDKELMRISQEGQLFLNIDEMKTIQKYFRKLRRDPTDAELETIAQTWSEHCFHKTFRGNIHYTWTEKGKKKSKTIRNLLKSTIVKATEKLDKSWCVSVFHDNAGVIKFDKDHHICFKVETHNHPSALEPFGGANTGIGGVIRDILGTGLGAKPIANTDVFCFAPPDTPVDKLPPGTLHPRRVMKGVVSGVRDYGNKMGIPTVNGAILFDERFIGNPLVYCGTVGLIPKDRVKKKVRKGDLIVVLGGKTGRDGIHGATFSSGELTTESEVVSSGAVQIGHPIEEKRVADALLKARDENLYSALTDCGAGGFSSAVGEMGEHVGAKVFLDQAPLKYRGLNYHEIWISESQERMVLSVPPAKLKRLKEICETENVTVAVIGEFTGSKRLELCFHNHLVCDLDMAFLHEANPRITKKAVWSKPKLTNVRVAKNLDLESKLLEVLGHLNVCSKEWIIRQYDHEVQGGTIIKPLVGVNADGPSDAAVVLPKLGSFKGIAISNGVNFRYGDIDPFWMAASCIDEAVRQIISVGGKRDKIAILDNFCWGNPDKPDRLGGLVRASEGCYKAAINYETPFISGKDSLYNEYAQGRKSIAIPGTLLISAVGIVDDVRRCLTMDLKGPDHVLYCVGDTRDELGGSIYYDTFNKLGVDVPRPNFKEAVLTFDKLSRAIEKGLIKSCHDCSEGGLAVAVAEMAFAGGFGADIDLIYLKTEGNITRDDVLLFSETNSRFIVEVAQDQVEAFEKAMKDVSLSRIGTTQNQKDMIVRGLNGDMIVHITLEKLKAAWKSPLAWN